MSPTKFDYYAPQSIDEALRMLGETEGAVVMAGGTDLLVKIKLGTMKPKSVIDIKRIEGLNEISFNKKKGLTIGAATLISSIASHRMILRHYPAVAHAASVMANVQIRNMGTIGGNLCNASPSADNAPMLVALGAEAVLASADGERRVPMAEFFKGPGSSAIERGEILSAISVPPPQPACGTSYQRISPRGKVDIATVCVGAMLRVKGKKCAEARVVLGAVAPIPMRAPDTEAALKGKTVTTALAKKAASVASAECSPITDVRAELGYRCHLVAVLTQRAIEESYQQALKR